MAIREEFESRSDEAFTVEITAFEIDLLMETIQAALSAEQRVGDPDGYDAMMARMKIHQRLHDILGEAGIGQEF